MSEAAVLTRTRTDVSHGGSILIIDDEAGIRESLETLLESMVDEDDEEDLTDDDRRAIAASRGFRGELRRGHAASIDQTNTGGNATNPLIIGA